MQPTRYGIVHCHREGLHVPRRFRIDLLLQRCKPCPAEIADCPGVKWSRITLPSGIRRTFW